MMDSGEINLFAGWLGMLGGVISGAVIGLFFHEDRWAGGYGSFRRRLIRLGHISFFGLGFVNLFYGLTISQISVPYNLSTIAGLSFIIGAITMPICCFLAAWKKPFRHLFPIPVLVVLAGIVITLYAWPIK